MTNDLTLLPIDWAAERDSKERQRYIENRMAARRWKQEKRRERRCEIMDSFIAGTSLAMGIALMIAVLGLAG